MAAVETPTGILLGHFEPGSPEWEQARGGLVVTATEIPAVLGLSPWQSKFSLWHKKAGLPSPPFAINEAMEWGIRLEPAVAAKWAEEHPEYRIVEAGTWRHKDRPWQVATPDRIAIRHCPGLSVGCPEGCDGQDPVGLVEVKTSPMGDGWDDGVPVYYRAQAIWQMDVLGYRTTQIALLVSGHDYREYRIEYDQADAELMRKAAREFLDDVASGVRPPIDSSDATYQTIRKQPEGREDVDVEIPGSLRDRYFTALNSSKAATAELLGVKSQVLDAIGNGRRAVCLGETVATRTVRDGKTHSLQPAKNRSTT